MRCCMNQGGVWMIDAFQRRTLGLAVPGCDMKNADCRGCFSTTKPWPKKVQTTLPSFPVVMRAGGKFILRRPPRCRGLWTAFRDAKYFIRCVWLQRPKFNVKCTSFEDSGNLYSKTHVLDNGWRWQTTFASNEFELKSCRRTQHRYERCSWHYQTQNLISMLPKQKNMFFKI